MNFVCFFVINSEQSIEENNLSRVGKGRPEKRTRKVKNKLRRLVAQVQRHNHRGTKSSQTSGAFKSNW